MGEAAMPGVVIGVVTLVSIFSLADGLEAFSRAEIQATTDHHATGVAAVTTDRCRRTAWKAGLGRRALVWLREDQGGTVEYGVAHDRLRFAIIPGSHQPGGLP
jgi:hypothetical protein